MSRCRLAVPGEGDEYAGVAGVYDTLIEPFLRRMRRAVAKRVTEAGCTSLLDVACGTGMQLALLEGANLSRTGIDASGAMLRVARARTSQAISYVHGDASRMPFEDHAFDCVSVSFALHEMAEEARAGVLAEMARVTARGGRVLVADYAMPQGVSARLAMAGAAVVERGAGTRHHACFRTFMARGGVPGLAEPLGLAPTRVGAFLMGACGLYEIRMP
jgi:ubiquinone/menaquinone biosynthesis C-methylase UbiE